jgi:hypothetical protein
MKKEFKGKKNSQARGGENKGYLKLFSGFEFF